MLKLYCLSCLFLFNTVSLLGQSDSIIEQQLAKSENKRLVDIVSKLARSLRSRLNAGESKHDLDHVSQQISALIDKALFDAHSADIALRALTIFDKSLARTQDSIQSLCVIFDPIYKAVTVFGPRSVAILNIVDDFLNSNKKLEEFSSKHEGIVRCGPGCGGLSDS